MLNSDSQTPKIDLPEIVRLSGLQNRPKLPHKNTLCETVQHGGRCYKVRAYTNTLQAQQRLAIISALPNAFSYCHGGFDRFLIMDYISGRLVGWKEGSTYFVEFLDTLIKSSSEFAYSASTDQFERWCREIRNSGVFRPNTVTAIFDHYKKHYSSRIRWNYEYYDLMPRNFVLLENAKFVCIDEKHVHPGPRGVSLVKLKWDLPSNVFASFQKDFAFRTNSPEVNDPRYFSFLEFYYLTFSLAFNGADRSLLTNLSVRQFHVRRRKMLQQIGASQLTRLKEQFLWLIGFAMLHFSKRLFRKFKVGFGPFTPNL